jgi:cytoskeletal protein CcmA (bactofilin family)
VKGDVTYGSIGIEHGAQIVGLIIQGADREPATQAQSVIASAKDKR